MKELTVQEINNIEEGEYLIRANSNSKTREYKGKVSIRKFGDHPMAVLEGNRLAWWCGEFTEEDNNRLQVFKM